MSDEDGDTSGPWYFRYLRGLAPCSVKRAVEACPTQKKAWHLQSSHVSRRSAQIPSARSYAVHSTQTLRQHTFGPSRKRRSSTDIRHSDCDPAILFTKSGLSSSPSLPFVSVVHKSHATRNCLPPHTPPILLFQTHHLSSSTTTRTAESECPQ